MTPPILDTWRAMEKLVDEGLVRAIGVSNFSEKKLRALIARAPSRERVPGGDSSVLAPGASAHILQRTVHVTAYSPLGRRTAPPCSAGTRQRSCATPRSSTSPNARGKTSDKFWCDGRCRRVRRVRCCPRARTPRGSDPISTFSTGLDDDAARTLGSLATQRRMVDGSFWLSPRGRTGRSTTCGTTKRRREDVGDVVFYPRRYHNHAASRIFLRIKSRPRQPNTPGSTPTTSYPSSLYSRTTPGFFIATWRNIAGERICAANVSAPRASPSRAPVPSPIQTP